MAGEDPGVGVITLLLDLIQRGWSAVTGVAKSVVGGIMDIVKTSLFFSWRRKMMQGQKGPDLEHGEQSLKDLRLHEQVGARIVTVEIGDETTMEALRIELKRLELDFAITEHDGQYTLHYKEVNEQDVLYAQQVALEKLYGTPNQGEPDDRDQQDRDDRQDEEERRGDDRGWDEREEREQDDRREGRERSDDEFDQQGEQNQNQDQGDHRDNRDQNGRDEQERQNQQEQELDRRDNGQRVEPAPIPVPIEMRESHSDEKVSRGKHARQEAPSLAERMPAAPSQPQQMPKIKTQAKDAPQFEPLENLIAQARERAAAKNAGRSHAMDRTKDRVRAREISFEH